MLITIFYIITCALVFALASVYYIHMFQLNGYHRDAHMRWFGDTLGVHAAKLTPAFVALVLACIPNAVCLSCAVILNVISVLFLFA